MKALDYVTKKVNDFFNRQNECTQCMSINIKKLPNKKGRTKTLIMPFEHEIELT